jgi:hypothetical protein
MSAAVRFERSVAIAAPALRVFAELSEPRRFLGLQPLLASLEELAAGEGVRAFAATERVRVLGPLALPSRLRVELRPRPAERRIEFATRAPLGIMLGGEFAIEADGDASIVHERVAVACPRWLRAFVVPQAVRAQEALLANLKRRLEAGIA